MCARSQPGITCVDVLLTQDDILGEQARSVIKLQRETNKGIYSHIILPGVMDQAVVPLPQNLWSVELSLIQIGLVLCSRT